MVVFVKASIDPVRDEDGNYHNYETRTPRMAKVSDMATEMRNLLYGSIAVDALTIRLKNEYTDDFDFVEFNGKKYRQTMGRDLRAKQTLQVISDG